MFHNPLRHHYVVFFNSALVKKIQENCIKKRGKIEELGLIEHHITAALTLLTLLTLLSMTLVIASVKEIPALMVSLFFFFNKGIHC